MSSPILIVTDTVSDVSDGPGPSRTTADVDLSPDDDEVIIAQNEERPARRVTGPVAVEVTPAGALVAVFTIYDRTVSLSED